MCARYVITSPAAVKRPANDDVPLIAPAPAATETAMLTKAAKPNASRRYSSGS